MNEKTCGACKWRSDDFSSVCTNGNSPNRGDFVLAEDSCDEFEEEEEE